MEWTTTIDVEPRAEIQIQRTYAQPIPNQPIEPPIIEEIDLTEEGKRLGKKAVDKAVGAATAYVEKEKPHVPSLFRDLWNLYATGISILLIIGLHIGFTSQRPFLNLLRSAVMGWGGIGLGGELERSKNDSVTSLRRAIIGQESGEDFTAINPHSGALGYAQVMPDNVPDWTKEALGRSLSSDEFLNDRDAQIKTIDHKLQEYWDEAAAETKDKDEIVRRVAAKWYSGQSDLWDNTRPQTYNGHSYPSIADYTQKVLDRYRNEVSNGDIGEPVLPVAGLTYSENERQYPSGGNDFGPRQSQPTLNGSMTSSIHEGYDWDCAIGTPIMAIWPGVVSFSGVQNGYGVSVKIEHPNKYTTLYGHHSQNLVKAGDRVEAGDIIAYCGQTGNSTGPHLHLGIVDDSGKYIDPEPFFK